MKTRYILKSLAINSIILFVVITLNFFLPMMMFDDPATPYYAGVPEEEILLREEIREEYGFNDPLIVQYGNYLVRIFTLDFGDSYYYKDSVINVMFSRIPWSLFLNLTTLVISVSLGILIGAIAGKNRGKWQDSTILKLNTLQTAIPSFWLALMAVMLFAFILPIFPYGGAMTAGYQLNFNSLTFFLLFFSFLAVAILLYKLLKKGWVLYVLPIVGIFISAILSIPIDDTLDVLYHAILPIVVVSLGGVLSYAMSVRNNMISVIGEDYITTARAKGLPSKVVLYKHTFKNSLLPLVTSLGMSFAGLFGGSVLIEQIFSWPGMGQLMLEANSNGDYLLLQAILLFFAVLTILANFITDLIYHRLDPRVSVSK